MQNMTIRGTITDYETDGYDFVVLKMDTSLSLSYRITLDGENSVDEFMAKCGVDTLHALKGLSFAIEVGAVIDDKTGLPTDFGPIDMELLTDDAPLSNIELWTRAANYVRYRVPDCLKPSAQ